MIPFLIPFFTAFFLFLLNASPSHGSATYIETGFGTGQISGGNGLYGSGTPKRTDFGFAQNATFAIAFGSANSFLQLHLGIQQRITSGSSSGMTYSLLSAYPLIRLETPRMYFGFGASPFVWKKSGTSSDFITGYSKVTSAVGGFGEVGLLWRVVPFFNLALAGSAEAVSRSGQLSPSPALQIGLQLRFFLGDGMKSTGKKKYDGWRYPFGIELF